MEQETALEILKSGRNVFLTGSAGTGKTYVLNQYIEYLKKNKITAAITASTGIAATHLNGQTIHAWTGIGIKKTISHGDLLGMQARKPHRDRLEKVRVLIIDEISMLHLNQLNLVNEVLKFFKNNRFAFGGIQVIFCGDFFQLPPIGEAGERSSDKFAFMSESWLEAQPVICYLNKQYRQNDDELNGILNEIRLGKVSEISLNHLKQAKDQNLKLSYEPIKLYTHNIDVDKVNEQYLEHLPVKSKKYKATTSGDKKIIEMLKKSIIATEKLELKIGAKVMFIKNNPDKGYINGTLGMVTDYSELGFPLVKTLKQESIIASSEKWEVEDDNGKVLASFSQIPLRLAWAITVHKSQGMTLDAVEMDLSKVFEKGQGYVALSRARSLDKLKLNGFNKTALEVDSLAVKADTRFQELSVQFKRDMDKNVLEQEAVEFLKKNKRKD